MVQSIQRASDILNYIAHHNNDVKLADISHDLNINKSTIHGLLQTLVSCGLLSQNRDTNRYSLGLKVYELGKIFERDFSLTEIARPFMQELNERFEETIHLSIESNGEVLYIDRIKSNHSVRSASNIGGIDPLYATSAGKVMLAHMSQDYVEEYFRGRELRAYTPNTITDAAAIIGQLYTIRRQGYALDNEEVEIGLRCVSAPILNADGSILGAISISGPTTRLTDERFQDMSRALAGTCLAISRKLGY